MFRVLDVRGEAPFRQAYLRMAETNFQLSWWGSVLVLLLALLLTILLSDAGARFGAAMVHGLCKPRMRFFAVSVGLLAGTLALLVGEFLYQGLYTNLDEMASAIHARYLASGHLAGPGLAYPEAWLITNTLMVEEGWVSHYPPGHLALMAAFIRLGAPRLLGPVLVGFMAWLLALSFSRLLPDRLGVARAGALLVAVSPFILLIGGGGLSHVTAGATAAAVLYASLRARDGNWTWGLAVGSAVGLLVCSRPLVGLVLGVAVPLFAWGPSLATRGVRWSAARACSTVIGGLPFAVALGVFNHRLFGAATRFGYLAAFGDNHALGFHLDPWGYPYGMASALAFTSMDLLAAGVQLLETPLPLTLVLGVYLLLSPAMPRGTGVILAWAFLPALANAFYWFHDPRMLFEAAPAWILLGVLAIGEVSGRTPPGFHGEDATSRVNRRAGIGRLGQLTSWGAIVAILAAGIWGAPNRWRGYSWTPETLTRIQVPSFPSDSPPLVFVHSSWNERLSSRLQGAGGMRQDSIVSALRRNTNCSLQVYADAREVAARGIGGRIETPAIDLSQEAQAPEGLVLAPAEGGMSFRTRLGEVLTEGCVREMRADRFGAVALAPLLWQGDLPGEEEGGPLFARDLGPERNQVVRDLFPGRPVFVFAPFGIGEPPEVVDYDLAMEVLWGADPVEELQSQNAGDLPD